MKNILTVATAGLKIDQLTDRDHLQYGRTDYLELHEKIGADILNYDIYDKFMLGNIFRNLEIQLRSDVYLSYLVSQKQSNYELIFAMSERAGIPIAALRQLTRDKRKFVTMFQSWSWRQELVIRSLNLIATMDAIFVHCESMKHKFIQMGASENRIHVLPYSVDQTFFVPQPLIERQPNLIVSIGETRSRDYGMLFRAVENLPVELIVSAGGSWYAREKRKKIKNPLQHNIHLSGYLNPAQLRDLYTRCQIVVLPIRNLIYSAGATGAMEAASMQRAVIAPRSRGITDFIINGETGILVEPGNEYELRCAIEFLTKNPKEADRLGRNARQWVEEKYNFDNYVECMAKLLLDYRNGR